MSARLHASRRQLKHWRNATWVTSPEKSSQRRDAQGISGYRDVKQVLQRIHQEKLRTRLKLPSTVLRSR